MTPRIKLDSQITFLTTTDLEKTSRFYEDTLGLTLVLDQGRCRIFKVSGAAYVGFCQKDTMPSTEGMIFTLVTQDVDGFCKVLRERGVKLDKQPTFNPDYNIYHCFLRDPNGYLIEIQRFEDSSWSKVVSQN